jgi:hypothetical protein
MREIHPCLNGCAGDSRKFELGLNEILGNASAPNNQEICGKWLFYF